MKRKIAAILSVCLICASAFASCGDSDGSKKKKSSSDAEIVSAEDASASSEAGEEESSDGEGEEKTTGDEKEESSTGTSNEKTTSADPDAEETSADPFEDLGETLLGGAIVSAEEAPKPAGGDVKGKWRIDYSEDSSENLILDFRADGKVDMISDISESMHFSKDGEFYIDSIKVPSNYVEYDGRMIRVKLTVEALADAYGISDEDVSDELLQFLEGKDLFVLERVGDADKNNMDGEYKFAGGVYGEQILAGEVAESYSLLIEGETLKLLVSGAVDYKTNGDTLTFEGDSAVSDELGGGDVKYTVEGDKLYVYSQDEKEAAVFERVK